jgi:hypothetical protein
VTSGPAALETRDEIGAFGQVLLAEFMLAGAPAGITGVTIRADVAAVAGLRGVADHENF